MKSKVWMCQSYLEGKTKLCDMDRGRNLGGREKERENGGRIRYKKRWERSTEGQNIEQKYVAVEDGKLGVATKKSQMPETQEVSWTKPG